MRVVVPVADPAFFNLLFIFSFILQNIYRYLQFSENMIVRNKLRDQYIFYEKIKKTNNYKHISLIYCLFFFYFTKYLQTQTILRRDFVIRASPPTQAPDTT